MVGSSALSTDWLVEHLRCPVCTERLIDQGNRWVCQGKSGTHEFPEVAGRPILINEDNSVFRIGDFTDRGFTMGSKVAPVNLKQRMLGLVPRTGENREAAVQIARLQSLLREECANPRVLVIGGGTLGAGMETLIGDQAVAVIETDVSLAERTQIVCDGHDLPFADRSFDAVVIQAVLEHVADPPRVVAEIWRVLKPAGFVYAETPFMQQVHNGPYDFTRYTHLGHRRLFRWFEEIGSGPIGGPGIALSWSFDFFLRSLPPAGHRRARTVAGLGARLGTWWLKYVDRRLASRPQMYDGAWAYYFLGRSSDTPITDRELIALYRGRVTG